MVSRSVIVELEGLQETLGAEWPGRTHAEREAQASGTHDRHPTIAVKGLDLISDFNENKPQWWTPCPNDMHGFRAT